MKRPAGGLREGKRKDRPPEIACPFMGNYCAADAAFPVDDVKTLDEALKQNGKRYDIKIDDAKHASRRLQGFSAAVEEYRDVLCAPLRCVV